MSHRQSSLIHVNWRRETIYPALALAETCLITPWLLALLSTSHQRFSPTQVASACLALILGTFYLARVMEALRVTALAQYAVILFGLISLSAWTLRLVVFNGPEWTGGEWLFASFRDLTALFRWLPGAAVAVLSVTVLFWRGLRLAQKPLSVMDIMAGFQTGIIVLALFAMMTTEREIIVFTPPFFFSQLLAIGLTRVETISQTHGGKRPPLSAGWLLILLGSTGIVIAFASVVNAIVSGVGPDKLLFWVGPLLAILTLPLMLLAFLFMGLFELIVRPLVNAIAPILRELMTLLQQFQAWLSGLAASFKLPPALLYLAPRVIGYGLSILIVLLVLAALILVARMVGRQRALHQDMGDEEYESIWSSQALLKKMAAQLQRRLAGLRKLAEIAGRFGAGGLFTALTIRRIYAQTVGLAASRGYPRFPSRTPYEHLATLQQAIPGCEAEMSQITEAYVGVHYGELPEYPDALAEIHAAFERVKEASRQVDKEADRQGDKVTR